MANRVPMANRAGTQRTPRTDRTLHGATLPETILIVAAVALAGTAGLSTLGFAFDAAIRGEASASGARYLHASSDGPPAHVGPSAQAGIGAALAHAGELARAPIRALRDAREWRSNPLRGMAEVVRWDEVTPAHVDQAVTRGIRQAERRYARLSSRWDLRSPSRKVNALDHYDAEIGLVQPELNYAQKVAWHLSAVLDNKELGDAFGRAEDTIKELATRMQTEPKLQTAIERIRKSRGFEKLDAGEQRLVDLLLNERRRNGSALGAAERTRLVALEQRLAELARDFEKNATAANARVEVLVDDAAKLEGLSPDYVARAKASAEAAGKPGYRLSMADGTAFEAIERVHDAGVREQIWRRMQARGTEEGIDNRVLAEEILALRREKADLLGYDSFSDFVTETRMVKSGANAEAFVDDLTAKTRAAAEKEYADLRAFRKSVDGVDSLEAWDEAYWFRRMSDTLVDSEKVRDYLPLDQALAGFFHTAGELYGVRFEEVAMPKWHDEVRSFRVIDESGVSRGTIQLDLFSRDGKRSGAWQDTVLLGRGSDPTTVNVVANFDPPSKAGETARLRVGEVETLFHEFGHAFHALLSDVELRSLGGTNVAWDFVELPSQIMENFVWEPKVLESMAKHHLTGEALPAELTTALLEARAFGAARMQLRQLFQSKLDLALHRRYDPAVHGDVMKFANDIAAEFALPGSKAQPANILPIFSHLFAGGYASGYYGYKWAEVLDADAYTRFAADGSLSRRVGDEFRTKLLSRGSAEDADALYRNFMGRDPDPGALQRRNGLESRDK
jgi:oligopeptidase A